MKVKFFVYTLVFFAVIVSAPKNTKAQIPTLNLQAIMQMITTVKNGVEQVKSFGNIQDQLSGITGALGISDLSAFDVVKGALKGGDIGGLLAMVQERAGLSSLGLNLDDYKDATKIEDAIAGFVGSGRDVSLADFQENMKVGKKLVNAASSNAYSSAVAIKAEAENMAQASEDIQGSIEQSTSVRDDLVNNNLLATNNTDYLSRMLDLYASNLEVSSSKAIKDSAVEGSNEEEPVT